MTYEEAQLVAFAINDGIGGSAEVAGRLDVFFPDINWQKLMWYAPVRPADEDAFQRRLNDWKGKNGLG